MTIILTARPGLAAADLAFGLYRMGVAQDASALTVTERTVDTIASEYVVNGLPATAPGEHWTLTYDDGTQRGAIRYPILADQPPNLVLPIRQAGETLSSLGARLYLDGAVVALGDLTLTDLGVPLRDYLVTELPVPDSGSIYTLGVSFGGVSSTYSWPQQVDGINTSIPPAQCEIVEELEDMFPDTLVAQPGVHDAFGDFIPSGAALSVPCYIEGESILVRDRQGREMVSSFQVIVGGAYGLTVDDYRYTLPVRYSPRTDLTAIGVIPVSDEGGACYEQVNLP